MDYFDLFTHSSAYNILNKDIKNKKLVHAYLIASQDVMLTNKYASFFAYGVLSGQMDNLTGVEWDKIVNKNRADVIWYPRYDKVISSDEVSDIINTSLVAPLEHDKKVMILSDFDDMRVDNQNKLLKTIEEANEHTVFVVLAKSIDNVIPTIRSRCQKIELAEVNYNDMCAFLMGKVKSDYKMIASLSNGSVTEAIRLDKTNAMELMDMAVDMMMSMGRSSDVIVYSSKILATKNEMDFVDVLLNVLYQIDKVRAFGITQTNKYSASLLALSRAYNATCIALIAKRINYVKRASVTNCNAVALIDGLLMYILEVRYKYGKNGN